MVTAGRSGPTRSIRPMENPSPRPAWHWYALAGAILAILLVLELSGVAAPLGP